MISVTAPFILSMGPPNAEAWMPALFRHWHAVNELLPVSWTPRKVFYGTGGGRWNDGNLRESSSSSRSGNVWDNAAMESFFSSLKTERIARRIYRTRDEARADVFDYIERFYNTKRRHSTIGYLSPMEFEMKAGFA
jgi:hypothetical protein